MLTLGETAEQALRVVREAPIIAYDTETSGLDWKINHAVGYVITAPDFNSYIPVRHGGGCNLSDPNCAPLITPTDTNVKRHQFEIDLARAFIVRREKGLLTVGHHLKFDMHMSANHGVMLGRECEDTGVNAAMLDEFTRSFSLDALAKEAGVTQKLGDDLYAHLADLFGGTADKKQMEHYWRLAGNDKLGSEYAMGDGVSTLALRQWQIKQIEEEEMLYIHNIESQLIWTIFRMERRGIKVDLTRCDEVEAQIEKDLKAARLTLPEGFNARSGLQVKAVLEAAGATNWPMTDPSSRFPNGQPSFPEKWLKKSPVGKSIVAVRKLENLNSSFLQPLKTEHTFNGRVYSSLNQMKGDEYGTISGRFSSSQPNLQQIPKRDKELGRLFRSVFIPDPGMDFYEADYSQCEPRLFAHYSKEPSLLDGYNQSPFVDMHAVVAKAFSVERDPTAKRMNMGILTGMQVPSFADHMGWTKAEAQVQFDAWFRLFPGIKDFQNLVTGVFRGSGYVKTLLKRRCRLDHPRYAYRGVSRVIQGGNADIVKYKLLQVDKWLEGTYEKLLQLLMTVHDSFNWQAQKGAEGERLSKEAVSLFCDVQTEPFNLRVPFVMDVGHGENWAIATYGPLKPGSGPS